MNGIDFEDARTRGAKRGRKMARRILDKWKRIDTEIAIGELVDKITSNPELKQAQNPAQIREMEERYGES